MAVHMDQKTRRNEVGCVKETAMETRTFNVERLKKMGLEFETEAELALFSEVITGAFTQRLIAAGEQLIDFEGFTSYYEGKAEEDAVLKWLNGSFEDGKKVIAQCEKQLSREIVQYRSEIPGLCPSPSTALLETTLEELDLSVRCFNTLKRAGLNTVSDVLTFGDLAKIRTLGGRCVNEMKQKLIELGIQKSGSDQLCVDRVS